MNTPYRVYFVQDDVNETLEEIYTNEQRPLKVSVLINKGTHDPHSPILVEKDVDHNTFRGKIAMEFQRLIEDLVEPCDLLVSPVSIVAFKLYRLI